jgi:hypothetical protein
MPQFRRSALRGSDELFRPTQPDGASDRVAAAAEAPPAPVVPRPDGRLVRLTDDEIAVLVDAIQRLKFPSSHKPPVTKPSVDDFERLEELRRKLLSR